MKCLICEKMINCVKQDIPFIDMIMKEMYSVSQSDFIVVDCPCLSVYNDKQELIGLSETFIKDHGEA